MRISDWSSDVCSSDLRRRPSAAPFTGPRRREQAADRRGVATVRQARLSIWPARGLRLILIPQQRGEGAHRFRLVAVPHRARDREKIRPRLDQRPGVRGRDPAEDRKSVVWGKSVSVRVDLGGRRIIKKKTNKEKNK